jgi:glycosyltransferase involved in cell wall biosynthesis
MRILIASSHPFIPQIAGGAQSSSHELALNLLARGYDVAMLCGLLGRGWLGLRNRAIMKVTGRHMATDWDMGYKVYRAWFAWRAAADVCAEFRPHAIMLKSGHPVRIAEALRGCGAAMIPCFHNVEFDTDLGGDARVLKPYPCISNSQFTANAYKEAFGIDSTVVHPFIRPELYRTRGEGEAVLFINPVPEKGVELAIALARLCPGIPFIFVEAWTLERTAKARLLSILATLPNVTFVSRTSDMRALYERARVVLAPSQYEEAFGRIAAEAHVSGIPVLASRRGGLPEAVGPGGVLLDSSEPAETWAAALQRLWVDKVYYQRLSEAALVYSRRPELDAEKQLDSFIKVIESAVASQTPSARADALLD